jgi:hypothetical protein
MRQKEDVAQCIGLRVEIMVGVCGLVLSSMKGAWFDV